MARHAATLAMALSGDSLEDGKLLQILLKK
jgi:hypothetical protein